MKRTQVIPSVAPSSWQQLHDRANAYFDLAPWEWMEDCDIFGVEDPETHDIGFCSVLGAADVCHGLALYRGAEGFRVLQGTRDGTIEQADLPYIQDVILMSFVPRGELDPQDKAALKQLAPVKAKRGRPWPQFRSYRPGFVPWYLTEEEARFMAQVLERVCDLSLMFRENPNLLVPSAPGTILTSVPVSRGDRTTWEERTITVPEAPKAAPPPMAPFDEVRAQRIQNRCTRRMETWEAATPFFPAPIDAERPYYPRVVLLADGASGFLFATELLGPGHNPADAVLERILKAAEEHSALPRRIAVRDDLLWKSLGEFCGRLGIELSRQKRLAAVEEAYEEMQRSLLRE
jgi:Domain of unknown function (DUF6930)